MGSIFYNLILSFYYLLVIKYGFKEPKLEKIQVWLHAPPLLFAFGLAFAGISILRAGSGTFLPNTVFFVGV